MTYQQHTPWFRLRCEDFGHTLLFALLLHDGVKALVADSVKFPIIVGQRRLVSGTLAAHHLRSFNTSCKICDSVSFCFNSNTHLTHSAREVAHHKFLYVLNVYNWQVCTHNATGPTVMSPSEHSRKRWTTLHAHTGLLVLYPGWGSFP